MRLETYLSAHVSLLRRVLAGTILAAVAALPAHAVPLISEVTSSVVAVPEPASMILLGSAVIGLARVRRFRRNKTAT